MVWMYKDAVASGSAVGGWGLRLKRRALLRPVAVVGVQVHGCLVGFLGVRVSVVVGGANLQSPADSVWWVGRAGTGRLSSIGASARVKLFIHGASPLARLLIGLPWTSGQWVLQHAHA